MPKSRLFILEMDMVFKSHFFVILLISISILACETKQLHEAGISFDFPNEDSLVIKIVHYPIFEEEVLEQLDLDTADYGGMRLELSKPIMSYFIINDSRYKLYLKPGYNLRISRDTTGSKESVLFEGEGAPINNYINHITGLFLAENFIDYDLKKFTRKYDSLNVVIETFSSSFFHRFPLSDEEVKLLKQINEIQLLSLKAEYGYRAHNNAIIDQAMKFQEDEHIGEITRPDDFQRFFSEIPFDTSYLNEGMFGYKYLLLQYLLDKHASTFQFSAWGRPDLKWPRRCNSLLKKGVYPFEVKAYLIANDLKHWMSSQGITAEIDSIFNEFKIEFRGSIYINELQKIYDENANILPGHPAPDFSGSTIDGRPVSLREFKGNVVYVDLWATWCGPCIEEIPYAKNLQKAFKGDSIVFLNVSVDQDSAAWKRMLAKEKSWLGTHMIVDRHEVELIVRNYKVIGYPKYLLIDKMGKIVSTNALPPSSSEIKNEIASLLK